MFQSQHPYDIFARNGVVALSTAGLISLSAALIALTLLVPKKSHRNQILGYFVSLLVSNVLQSIGTAMSLKWVQLNSVVAGSFCSAQGGIKQAGNVGNALWSLVISVYLFNSLFLRYSASRAAFIATFIGGWGFVAFIVSIGPLAIQTSAKGPYFGISGDWCWIADDYPKEQTFLEYFFEYFSAGVSFILYTAILLRVRGNLTIEDGMPRLRFASKEDMWQLNLMCDFTDISVMRAVKQMIWYPVAYGILIVPIGLARLSEFAGFHVPHWATIVTDVIFNLTGLVNVVLLLLSHRLFPEIHVLPEFVTPRKQLSKSVHARMGIEPFMLGFKEQPVSVPVSVPFNRQFMTEKPLPPPPPALIRRSSSLSSLETFESTTSLTPLRRKSGILE